jgi:hypothetical protein
MFCYPHCYPTIPQYKILLSAGHTLVTIRDAGTQPAIPTPPLKSGPEHYPDAATSLFDDNDPHTRPGTEVDSRLCFRSEGHGLMSDLHRSVPDTYPRSSGDQNAWDLWVARG